MTLLSLQIKALKLVQCANHHVRQRTPFWKLHFLPLNKKSEHGCLEYGCEYYSPNWTLLANVPGKCCLLKIPITRNRKTEGRVQAVGKHRLIPLFHLYASILIETRNLIRFQELSWNFGSKSKPVYALVLVHGNL